MYGSPKIGKLTSYEWITDLMTQGFREKGQHVVPFPQVFSQTNVI